MKFETLRNNRKILLATVIVFVVILTLIITTSLAKYKVTESINIASGTINYSLSDLNLMGIYLESDSGYTQSDSIPESGYVLNETESYCKVGDTKQDVTISYEFDTKELQITPFTAKGLKCYLYFDEQLLAKDVILANIETITTRSSFSSGYTSSTTGKLFTAEDDDGISYYYAGAPTDNWVKFAGYYWRIIRINGDGTIRLIYNGTSTTTTGTETQLSSTSAFINTDYNSDNAYVGYMYSGGSVHGLGISSTIKGILETWYTSNLANYASYIDTNAGFCGDRTPSTSSDISNGSGGTGTTTTYYGDYIRYNNSGTPTLKCANSSDLFTTNNSSKGNKALTNPIGLINMNEVWMAGGNKSSNSSYYLYTNQDYWTISPSGFDSTAGGALVFGVNSAGALKNMFVDYPYYGVRPVINLKSDTLFLTGGTGTSSNPYVVS